MVVGPANHDYVWVAFAKEHCTAMVLLISSPMPQRGSRKCGTLGAWFSELPNKELGPMGGDMAVAKKKAKPAKKVIKRVTVASLRKIRADMS
jgi:hypothetical protein